MFNIKRLNASHEAEVIDFFNKNSNHIDSNNHKHERMSISKVFAKSVMLSYPKSRESKLVLDAVGDDENDDMKKIETVELKASSSQLKNSSDQVKLVSKANFAEINELPSKQVPLLKNYKFTSSSSSSGLSSDAVESVNEKIQSSPKVESKLKELLKNHNVYDSTSSVMLSTTTKSYDVNSPLSTSTLNTNNQTDCSVLSSTTICLDTTDTEGNQNQKDESINSEAVTLISGPNYVARTIQSRGNTSEWSSTNTELVNNTNNEDLSEIQSKSNVSGWSSTDTAIVYYNNDAAQDSSHHDQSEFESDTNSALLISTLNEKAPSETNSVWTTRTELKEIYEPQIPDRLRFNNTEETPILEPIKHILIQLKHELESSNDENNSTPRNSENLDSNKLRVNEDLGKVEKSNNSSLFSVKELSLISKNNSNLSLHLTKSESNLSQSLIVEKTEILNNNNNNNNNNAESCLYQGAMIKSIKSDMSGSIVRASVISYSSSENPTNQENKNLDSNVSSTATSIQTTPSVRSRIQQFEKFSSSTNNNKNRISLSSGSNVIGPWSTRASNSIYDSNFKFDTMSKNNVIAEEEDGQSGGDDSIGSRGDDEPFTKEHSKMNSFQSNIGYYFS